MIGRHSCPEPERSVVFELLYLSQHPIKVRRMNKVIHGLTISVHSDRCDMIAQSYNLFKTSRVVVVNAERDAM